MKKPYAIVSDSHNHNWSAFASVLHTGVNSRLQFTLNEFTRVAATLAPKGTMVYHAGDLFHVRGSVAPSVFNPTRETMSVATDTMDIEWCLIPGNHDLEGKHSDRLGSAVEMIRGRGIQVISKTTCYGAGDEQNVCLVPWYERVEDLKAELERMAKFDPRGTAATDLIIHAPVNGVIFGIPDHGLDPAYLDGLGFKRWFAGHYHNHKQMSERGYSIGALTHQTWSDVGTKAGFLIVYEDRVEWHETKAPKFVDIAGIPAGELEAACKGNFVRARVKAGTKPAQIEALREHLQAKCGALGVRIDPTREATRVREGVPTVKQGATLEEAIGSFITAKGMPNAEKVQVEAMKILAEAA